MNNYNGETDDNIRTIAIIIETNNSKEQFPLIYSKIVTSVKPEIEIPDQQLPYFVPNIKYPVSNLENKKYSSILKIFFDKEEFKKEIVDKGEKTNDYNDTNANILLMLNLLFPNTYPIKHNITTSFDKYLKQQRNTYRVKAINKAKQILLSESNDEYAKLSASDTISEIIWRNDVINDPMYSKLIRQLKEYELWREKARKNYENDKKTIHDKLLYALTNDKSDTYFTDADIDKLKQKIDIFDLDALNNEMMILFRKYMQPLSNKESEFQTKLKDMINYFISTNNKPIESFSEFEKKFDFKIDADIDMFQYFDSYKSVEQNKEAIDSLNKDINSRVINYNTLKGKLNPDSIRQSLIDSLKTLKIKNLTDAEKALTLINNYESDNRSGKNPNNTKWIITGTGQNAKVPPIKTSVVELVKKYKELDAIISKQNPLFKWVGISITSTTIDQIKKDLNTQITSLKRELWESVQKYNQSKRWSNVEYSSQKKIAKQINDIITIMTSIRKLQRVENINEIRSNILSLLDNIKILGRETAVSSIIQKVEKIKQLVDDKIGLDLIYKYILNAPGILYKYNEIRFDTENKQIFDYELKKEKYNFFIDTVNNIDGKIFQEKESMNPQFQKLLKDYLENNPNEFIKKVVDASYQIENPRKNQSVPIDDILNISVLKNNKFYNKNNTNDNDNAAYTINVYMEVIVGNLDKNTMSNLNCQYKDKDLSTRFLELMNNFKPSKIKIRPPFNIANAENEIEQKKKENQEKINSAKSVKRSSQGKRGRYTRKNRYK